MSIGLIGRICIYNLYSSEVILFKYRFPIGVLALDPLYGRRQKKRMFVFGTPIGQLIVNEKSRLKDLPIFISNRRLVGK